MEANELEQIEVRYRAAYDMVSALCKPRGAGGGRDWVMSIPAQPDYDPDLVIGASLLDIPRLIERVRIAEAERAVINAATDLVSDWHDEAEGDTEYFEMESDPVLVAAVDALNAAERK